MEFAIPIGGTSIRIQCVGIVIATSDKDHVVTGEERDRAIAPLVAKYPQYRVTAPRDAVVKCTVERWSGWAASDTAAP